MKLRIVGLVGLLLLCSVVTAAADPVTVTGGSVTSSSFDTSAFINLTGDGFSLSVGSEGIVTPLDQCHPCTSTAPVTLGFNGMIGLFNNGGKPGVFNGVSYAQTFFNGNLSFVGPTFDSSVLSPTNLTFTAPFTMTGTLLNYASGSDAFNGGPVVFTASLTGSGTATAQFLADPPSQQFGQLFEARSVTYQFAANPAATPEPTSLLLVGSAVAGILLRCRRRRSWARD